MCMSLCTTFNRRKSSFYCVPGRLFFFFYLTHCSPPPPVCVCVMDVCRTPVAISNKKKWPSVYYRFEFMYVYSCWMSNESKRLKGSAPVSHSFMTRHSRSFSVIDVPIAVLLWYNKLLRVFLRGKKMKSFQRHAYCSYFENKKTKQRKFLIHPRPK